MTVENGADMAANDILLPDDQIDGQEPDEVEVDYNGKSYCLPPELKDALLRQADYTRKTQELAEGRRALEAARVEHHQQVVRTRGHIQDAARIVALNDQLAQLSQVNWQALQAQNPARAQALYQQFEQLKDLRRRAARAWTQREQDHISHSQRATARRAQEVTYTTPAGCRQLRIRMVGGGGRAGIVAENAAGFGGGGGVRSGEMKRKNRRVFP